MSGFMFDPLDKGLRKVLRENEELALRYVWKEGERGAGSGSTWKHVNEKLKKRGGSISRAAIIGFLNKMVEQGVLDYEIRTGIGGEYKLYKTNLDEREYRKYLLRKIIESMMRDFPEETGQVLKEFE